MAFWRFGADEGLGAQRVALTEVAARCDDLERRLGNSASIKAEFARVWRDDATMDGLFRRLGQARTMIGLQQQRLEIARRELPSFDKPVADTKLYLAAIDRDFRHLVATLFARHLIANEAGAESSERVRVADELACQRALLRAASTLRETLKTHFDGLSALDPAGRANWPETLDLTNMERGLTDVGAALETYAERLASAAQPLSQDSTVRMADIVTTLDSWIGRIGDARADLAMDIAMRAAFRATGVADKPDR